MTIFNSVILVIVVILSGLHAQGRSRLRSPPPPQSPPPPPVVPFDHFLLVLSWPPAFCKELYISNSRACITPLPINFTLHGFWPSNNGNSQPRDCDSKEKKYPFDPNTVVAKVGEDQLNKDWPSLDVKIRDVPRRIDNLGFWGEQWKMHGTCSVSMLDQFQYFSKALKIYNVINVRNMLQKENVIPGGTLDTKAISSAIQNQMKLKPQIRCKQLQNQFYLYEIGLCLTASKDPEFIDCKDEFVGCPRYQKVYFL